MCVGNVDIQIGREAGRGKQEQPTEKNGSQGILLCTRKGLMSAVRAGLLASREHLLNRPSHPAWRDSDRSTSQLHSTALAYSCAAARDFHPASLSSSWRSRTREPIE